MQHEFWLNAWENRQIGFNQPQPNPYLKKYWPALELPQGSAVFVPLCGKSIDMVWLAEQGHRVTGVELSEIAIREFFAEQSLTPIEDEIEQFKRFRSGPYTLLAGDFFACTRAAIGRPAAVYDRAALVALPPEVRPVYAAKSGDLLTADDGILLLSFAYPQEQMSGPPFAVTTVEIEAIYSPHFQVSHLQDRDMLDKAPRFKAQGLEYLTLSVFQLRKNE